MGHATIERPEGRIERQQRYGYPEPGLNGSYLVDLVWNVTTGLIAVGGLILHDIEPHTEKAPQQGPVIFLTSHFSFLDVFAQMAVDPYPLRTMYPLKKELADLPVLGGVLGSYGAIPVSRDGHDIVALRKMMEGLQTGRTISIAAGGTRSRDGHLTPIDDAVCDFVLKRAEKGIIFGGSRVHVPIHPIVEVGTFEALPAEAVFPKREKIKVIIGDEIDFQEALIRGLSKDQRLLIAAGIIQKSLAQLLPLQNQPKEGMPVIWTKADYMEPEGFSHYTTRELKKITKRRIVEVPKRIAERRVYVERDPIATDRTTGFWDLFLRGRDIKGLKNFDRAIGAYSDRMPLTIVAPHVSDADTLFLEHSLRDAGRGEQADRLLYIAGLKMDERWYIRINTQGGNRVFVETPLVMKDLEEALEAGRYYPSRDLFEQYLNIARNLNVTAMREIISARKRQQIVVLYPQSTRSSDGFIQRGHPDTLAYLKKGIILPVMIRGSERFMPPKKSPPLLDWIVRGGTVDVEFGEPFKAEEARSKEVLKALDEMGANFVDLVMARISRMDWERMHPDIRPFHQMLDERFPTIPLASNP